MKTISFILSLLVLCMSSYAQKHERWDVKTISDGFSPDFNHIQKVTVAKLEFKPKIRIKNTQPRLNMEKQMVRITGTISRIKLEGGATGDNDYHIEVTDGTMGDSTIVCEAVDPDDSSATASPMHNKFITVRKLAKKLKVGDKVSFTGMLFQDK
jgi:hypothetical protein